MAHVRTFAAGEYSALSQQVLNELSAARICLLNEAKRAAYDEALRQRLQPASRKRETKPALDAAASPTRNVVAPPLMNEPIRIEPPLPLPLRVPGRSLAATRSRPPRGLPLAFGIVIGLALLGVGLVALALVAWDAAAPSGDEVAARTNSSATPNVPSLPPRNPSERSHVEPSPPATTAAPLTSATPGETGAPAKPVDVAPSGDPQADAPGPAARGNSPGDVPRPVPPDDPPARAASPTAPDDPRTRVPGGVELEDARNRAKMLADAELRSATTADAELAVVRTLRSRAKATVGDEPLRYALLLEARDLAVAKGEAPPACDVIEELGRSFAIDALAAKGQAITTAAAAAKGPRQHWRRGVVALVICERLAVDERFDRAASFASLAVEALRAAGNDELASHAERRLAAVQAAQRQFEAFLEGQQRLKDNADDAAANLAVGKYLCLVRGDLAAGLPKLAKGGDSVWQALARLESTERLTPVQQLRLADAWRRLASVERQADPDELRRHARYWYQQSLSGLAGSDRSRAARAAGELAGYPSTRLRQGVVTLIFNGADFQQRVAARIDLVVNWNFGFGSPDPAAPADYFSLKCLGWVQAEVPGRHVVTTATDDSVRLYLDGRLLIEHWNAGAASQKQAAAELGSEPHRIEFHFNEYQVSSAASMGWAFADFASDYHTPQVKLLHDPRVAREFIAP
jgi:hypothetical protein